jgi:hypothetical protein
MMGERNHMYGKTTSDEVKAKIAESHRGKTASPETRAKMSAAQSARQAQKRLDQQGANT